MVGNGANRPFFAFQCLYLHFGTFRQQSATPASWPERGNRRQRHQLGVDWQNRPMGGKIISGAAGRCRHEYAITDQLIHPHPPVNRDFQLGRLRRLAQQRNLVNSQRLMGLTGTVARGHQQWIQHRHIRLVQPVKQIRLAITVHQKADRAMIHAENRCAGMHIGVHGLKHHAITAKRDNHIGLFRRDAAISRRQRLLRCLRFGIATGHECQLFARFFSRHNIAVGS